MNDIQKLYKEMSQIDVSDSIDMKGGFSYLKWSVAWHLVKERFPQATYIVSRNEDGLPYITDGTNVFVEVVVDIPDFVTQSEVYAVTDNRNKSVPLEDITSFTINTAIRRALVKCIAQATGIGLSVYVDGDGGGMDESGIGKAEPVPVAVPTVTAPTIPMQKAAIINTLKSHESKAILKDIYMEVRERNNVPEASKVMALNALVVVEIMSAWQQAGFEIVI